MAHLVLLTLQEHGAEGGAEAPFSPFSINTGLIFWTLLIFLLLLAVLTWKVWPWILRSVEEREKRIQEQLDDAARANVDAQKLLDEHKRLLAGAKEETADILAKAKSAAENERVQILERARAEHAELLERARRVITDEKDRAVEDLRREAVDLSLAAASKLLDEKIDGEENRRIVEKYIQSIGDGK